jgi:PAS domain S-box-containing protein
MDVNEDSTANDPQRRQEPLASLSDLPSAVSTQASESNSVLDELPDGVLVLDANGRVEQANRAFLELTGLGRGEAVGQPLESLVADEDMLRLLGFERIFDERFSHDVNVLFLDKRGSNRALIVSSARVSASSRCFLTLRATGSVQQELADTSRWAAAEQQRADEVASARDALAAKHAALRAAQGELESAHAKLKQEVATRERLENELRLAQKLEGIGQLAAGIAHEINTPMQYIGDNVLFLSDSFEQLLGYLSIAKRVADEAGGEARARLAAAAEEISLDFLLEQVPQALTSSREGIGHVSGIVKAMKSFARTDQGEKAPCDLNQSIRDTLVVAQNEYKSVAKVEVDLDELPPVTCFASRLNQVILNLVVNAAHAIGDAHQSELGKIKVSSRVNGDCVEVTIADNGCGIPSAIRHRVFDQFFTTKAVGRGTGQGLAIARSIVVDAHGGSLSFVSESGAGTAFTLSIPIVGSGSS